MKKLIALGIILVLVVSMVACTTQPVSEEIPATTPQETVVQPTESPNVPQDTPAEQPVATEKDKNNLDKYIGLLGLNRDEIINTMEEEPVAIDEGGLEFSKAEIRVWFDDTGTSVSQIFTQNKAIDFNGAKVGDKVDVFNESFGAPTLEDQASGINQFDYNGLVLEVYYDSNTADVFAVYIMMNE